MCNRLQATAPQLPFCFTVASCRFCLIAAILIMIASGYAKWDGEQCTVTKLGGRPLRILRVGNLKLAHTQNRWMPIIGANYNESLAAWLLCIRLHPNLYSGAWLVIIHFSSVTCIPSLPHPSNYQTLGHTRRPALRTSFGRTLPWAVVPSWLAGSYPYGTNIYETYM